MIYLSQLEDDFVNEYMSEQLYMDEPSVVATRWDNDDLFFSDDGRVQIPDWLEDCLTLGLEELKIMFNADTADDRFYGLRSEYCPQGTWKNALNAMSRYTGEPRRRREQKPLVHTGFRDHVDKGGFGWFWLLN